MTDKLNLRLLEVFRAVMDANSVTDAAEMLNISQPAVSKALGLLEGNLNLRLFGRTHGRLHPTGDAHRLYAESERLFIQVNTFRDRVSRLSSGREGKLIVTAIPTLATSLVTHAAAKFGKERPNVKIHVVTANAADVAESVGRHRCDIGLLHSPVTDKTVIGNIIGESEIVAVMPENSPLSKLKRVTPADLDGVPLILNDSGSPPIHLLYEAFAAARLYPRRSSNRFWDGLSLEQGSAGIDGVGSAAELAYAQLAALWSEHGGDGREAEYMPILLRRNAGSPGAGIDRILSREHEVVSRCDQHGGFASGSAGAADRMPGLFETLYPVVDVPDVGQVGIVERIG